MEAEAPNAVLAMPAPGHRVEVLLLAERRVKGGVESDHLGDGGQGGLCGTDGGGGHGVVQRGKFSQRLDAFQDPVVDSHRLAKFGSAMHYPMPDRLNRKSPPSLAGEGQGGGGYA